MLHVDIPSRSDIERLISRRAPACVSLYLPTSPITQDAQADRIELKNLGRAGPRAAARPAPIDNARSPTSSERDRRPGRRRRVLGEFQANSLAVFVTPDRPRDLPPAESRSSSTVEVWDRFYVKPLLRAVTVPQTAFVLALAPGLGATRRGRRATCRPFAVDVADLPPSAAERRGQGLDPRSVAECGAFRDRRARRSRLRQYAREVDQALRELLGGLRDRP